MGFDPSVFIEYVMDPKDPDYGIGFRAYGFWGFQRSSAGQLDQKTMYSLRPGTESIGYFIPASSRYGVVRDPQGTTYPAVYPGEDLGSFNFFEAASIRKIGNKYVWVYSGYSGPEYGLSSTNSALRYAYGDTPVRSTNANGIVGYDLYETAYKLPSNETGIPTLSASASNPDVKVAITQAESKSGTAVVRFDYKGMVKTYRVVFAREYLRLPITPFIDSLFAFLLSHPAFL